MRLESLEMVGFKSFTEKTRISFLPGVTAIVGPNGCGKSNVADAIRWVLGEQSVRLMRGDRMEDVIFSGSEGRKSLGLAEVSLTFTHLTGDLAEEFGGYRQVAVTRRLHRSGESEYLINKVPCRLRDIRDVLLDAGVGSRAYAMIEQGRVEQLLDAKPQERRFLIEEVAGIVKYKTRKAEALRKLEATQQNLDRVRDIISEVRRQMNALDRQVKKAKRYKALQAEVREIDLQVGTVEFREMEAAWRQVHQDLAAHQEAEVQGVSRIAHEESTQEALKLQILEQEQAFSRLQTTRHDTESEIQRSEGSIQLLTARQTSVEDQASRARDEAAGLAQQAEALEARQQALERALQELDEGSATREARLNEEQEAYMETGTRLATLEEDLEEEKRSLFSVLSQATEVSNRAASLRQRLEGLGQDRLRSEREAQGGEETLAQATSAMETQAQVLARTTEEVQQGQEERGRLQARLAEREQTHQALLSRFRDLQDRLTERRSRWNSLRELEASLEGYPTAARAVLQSRDNGLSGILGLVADVIQTPEKYEVAIEGALGDRLQHVVVQEPETSAQAIRFLKERQTGRGTFIPLHPRGAPTTPFRDGAPGVVGEALSLVSYPETYREVAQYLLGDVVVVEDLESAMTLWHANGLQKTLVTLEGEVVDPWGAMAGGSPESSHGGILRKRREIRDLEAEVGALEGRSEEMAQALQQAEAGVEETREQLRAVEARLQEVTLQRVHGEKDLAVLEGERQRLLQKLEVLRVEQENRSHERAEAEAALAEAETELARLAQERTDRETQVQAFQEDMALQRDILEEQQDRLTEIKVALTAFREKREAAERELDRILAERDAVKSRLQEREEEGVSLAGQAERTREEIQRLDRVLEGLADRRVQLREEGVRLQELLSELGERLRETEERLHLERRTHEEIQRRVMETELRKAEVRMQLERVQERILERYHVSIEEVARGMELPDLDMEAARGKLEALRQKMEQMGPVNLAALEEHQELKTRHDFMSSQHQDLVESVNALRKAISRINRTTSNLFHEAFQAVNEKFQEVFRTLFQGGRAELVLLQETGDVFDAGIEIRAEPPGKKLQSLSLFSGGEKALMAIALLFACFLVRPSPFCVLDEVDAPLDDANIHRFTRLLKSLVRQTQFVIITHNKQTMGVADALHGITMEEPGVSALLSIQLAEAQTA